MSGNFNDFETEVREVEDFENVLLPEDWENLEKAMNECVEVFSAPGEADPERAFQAIEAFEEVHPSFSDTQISDRIGELIELLHEVCGEAVLGFEDAKRGKGIIQNLAQIFGIPLSHLGIDPIFKETGSR